MSQCEKIKSIDTHTSDSSCVSNTANSSNLLNNINDTNEIAKRIINRISESIFLNIVK